MPIYFYKVNEPYGCFSNFSAHPIQIDGEIWPTSEHYFQAQKFISTAPEYAEKIRLEPSPMKAANMGRSRKVPLRTDWEEVKDDVMRKAVYAKVKAYADVRETLISTHQEVLIEKTTKDMYWGCGSDGSGKNMLGKILMEIRSQLQNSSV